MPTPQISSDFLPEYLRLLRQREAVTGRPTSPGMIRAGLQAELGSRREAAQRQAVIERGLRLQERQAAAEKRTAAVSGITQAGGSAATLGLLYKSGYFSQAPAALTQPQMGQNIVAATQAGLKAGGAGAVTPAAVGPAVASPGAAGVPALLSPAAPAYTAPTTISTGLFGAPAAAATTPAVPLAAETTTAAIAAPAAEAAAAPAGAVLAPAAVGFGTGLGISKLAAGIKDTEARRGVSQAGGAAGGALAGAAIGSVVPGIGTVVGALVGGISGLIGGVSGDKP